MGFRDHDEADQPYPAAHEPGTSRTGGSGQGRTTRSLCHRLGEIIIATDRGRTSRRCNNDIDPADSCVRNAADSSAPLRSLRTAGPGRRRWTQRPFSERGPPSSTRWAAGAVDHVMLVMDPSPHCAADGCRVRGAGLDGIVAKPLMILVPADKRTMFKIKHERTADCVVAGYRLHNTGGDASGPCCSGSTPSTAGCSTSA